MHEAIAMRGLQAFMVDKLEREKRIVANKVKFVTMVVNEELKVNNRKRKDLLSDLKLKGFEPMSKIKVL